MFKFLSDLSNLLCCLFSQEVACFKIAALQKVLDSSVPLSELEVANKQYNALTAKYREMLQKDNLLVQRTTNMEHMEVMFMFHFEWADRKGFRFGSLFICLFAL